MRITEAIRLRVKDVDFARREIVVRDGKGNKDRVTMLLVRLVVPLREQIAYARESHRVDLANASALSGSRSRSIASTRARCANGLGSTCSRPTCC